jgi:pimeloyl-ACP methyl ester carboxylesterase
VPQPEPVEGRSSVGDGAVRRPETPETSWATSRLSTADGESLALVHLPPLAEGEAPGGPNSFAVVLAPGFSGSSETPAVRSIVSGLRESAPAAGFLVVDLRGHGRSSGHTTLGDREVLDIDAVVAEARRLGYSRVVAMGWSMGGTCVLRHAALLGEQVHGHTVRCPVDAVATVSAVSRWEVRDTAAMRRLHRMIETRIGRGVARRFLKVRIDPAGKWAHTPLSPVEAVARISVPLLLVHGDKDHYFGWEHAQALAAASEGRESTLWLVPDLGHAEQSAANGDVPILLEQLGSALTTMADGKSAQDWPQGADAADGCVP